MHSKYTHFGTKWMAQMRILLQIYREPYVEKAVMNLCTTHLLQVVVAVIAASLHRRHLMIWGVFSPRFMYEGAFQATTDFCVILATALFGLLEGYTG